MRTRTPGLVVNFLGRRGEGGPRDPSKAGGKLERWWLARLGFVCPAFWKSFDERAKLLLPFAVGASCERGRFFLPTPDGCLNGISKFMR